MELHIYFYFQLIISLQVCRSQVRLDDANVMPFAPATPPKSSKCAHQTPTTVPKNALQFRLPFMDMNIQNERNLHIMQESLKKQIFILHGNELYVLIVSGQEKRISLIGLLAGGVRQHEPIGAKVIAWRNYLLLVIALEEYLEIYQLNAVILVQNADAAKLGQVGRDTITKFEPIQQLTISGRFRKLFLFNVAEGQIMLLTAVNYTKLQSKLRTFEWSNTFFELVEDLPIPAIHALEIVGTTPKFLLSGRLIKHQGRTIVVVYEVDTNDLHLRNRQTLTVPSSTIHAYTFRGRNYLIGCAAQQQRCNSFWMKRDEVQFSIYRQFSSKELSFERFRAGQHFLVGTQQRAVNIYPTARMDCYASYTAKESEVSEIVTHESQLNESFVLISYRRPFHTLLRIFEVEAADGKRLGASVAMNETMLEELNALQQHRHLFEGTIQRLRSLLLQRKTAMDIFRKAAFILRPKIKSLKTPHPVCLQAGNVGIVKVVGESLQSPMQLLTRVAALRTPQRSMRFMRAAYHNRGFVLDMPRVARVCRMYVGNLLYNGSLLSGFYLDNMLSTRQPILSIRSAIRTKVLSTSQLLTRQTFRNLRENDERSNNVPLKVRDLVVERINGVSVTELLQTLFLRNRDRKMKGALKLHGETKVDSLWTPLLNDLVVAELFNMKEPQIVSSKIMIESINVRDMQADLINGLNFTEDVAFSGRDDLIEGPVEIKQMNIAGDLLVDYQPKLERSNGDMYSQFRQFYTGKVIINGTLMIDNLEFDNATPTGIFVNGKSLARSVLKDTYLLQNTPQDIRTTVHFDNAKVTIPKFTSNWLNDHPTTQHLLITGHQMLENPLLLIFMQAKVDGDVICKAYKSKLRELSEDVVRYGDTANLTGVKIFEAPLIVEHLTAEQLKNVSASDLVLKSQLKNKYHFYGNKSFEKLVVTKDTYVEHNLNYTHLNNFNVNVPLRRDHFFKHLYLPYHLQITNIVLHEINGISFDKIFDRLSVENDKLVLHKDLLVKGNVEFPENLQVETINDISWSDYVSDLVRINEDAVINGPTVFMQGLTVKKTLKTLVNNIDMREVFSNVLLKSKPQQITGNYTFGNLRLTNLDVNTINDVPINTFIDTRNEKITLTGDLILPKLTVQGDVNGNFQHSFRYASLNEQLQQLSQRRWRNLVVHGNAFWNECSASDTKQYEELQYLYRHAVRRSGDQVISGTVYMTQPIISKMRTRTTFPKGVDLNYIARDCLLKNTTSPQTICSGKLFHKPLRLQRALITGPLNISTLNTINVHSFHASLYRISSNMPIEGPLHFKIPPIVGQLLVQGLVNGMPTAQIYTTSSGMMPPVKMYSLVVDEELQIGDVNDRSLDYLLSNRIRLNGEPQDVQGFLVFENLILNNETLLQSINGISIDDMVFKKSDHVQVIAGQKMIEGDLISNGPAHVLNLNGVRLIEMYKQSIFITANYHFDNLTIDEGTFVKGLVLVGNMPMKSNGRTMQAEETSETPADMLQVGTELEDLLKLEDNDAYREELTDVVNELSNLLTADNANLSNHHNNRSQQHLLYLDFDFSTEVLRQYANESVDVTFLTDLQHISMCEHRFLQVQYAAASRRLFITNVTTSHLTARTDTLWAKVQNYCGNRHKKVKSKVTVNGNKVAKVFGMRKYIESLELFVSDKQNTFLLLHAVDETRNRNEVRMLRINDERNDIADWQTIPFGVGKSMRLFKFKNFTVLLSSTLVNNQQAVSIYHFNTETEHFKLAQIIDGPYDVMELVAVQPQRYQLLLSCHKCHNINVYELTRKTVGSYKLLQIIKLPMRIDKLHTFIIGDGELHLLSLGEQQQDFYHLHKYAFIQGWVHSTFGYFRHIQLAVPLSGALSSTNGNDLLLLLCGGDETDRCSVVRAFTK